MGLAAQLEGVRSLIPFHIGLMQTEQWRAGETCRDLIADKEWLKQFAEPKAAPEDVAPDEIDTWLVGDPNKPAPERPSAISSGDTITIAAFKDSAETPKAADEDTDEEYERQEEEESEEEEEEATAEETPEEFVDESNQFYVKKKPEPEGPKKPVYKDTSDAASDILRKMMERRRGSR